MHGDPPFTGALRHPGWRAAGVSIPARSGLDPKIIAPAEVEIALTPRMSDARYVVGIDLGTTNCVLAWVDTAGVAPGEEAPRVEVLAVPQLVEPGVVEARAQLPSFLYLPAANEFPPASLDAAVGTSRARASASWRARAARRCRRASSRRRSRGCARRASIRTSAILPWNAPGDVPQVSPVDASARYLAASARGVGRGMPAPLARRRCTSPCRRRSTPRRAS